MIVLMTAGNRVHWDPSEESEASHAQTHWWETMEETLSSMTTYTKQQWIAEQAREHPERVFTSLHHLIDIEWMREAFRRTRKDGATGIDGVTATDYETELEAHLADLPDQVGPLFRAAGAAALHPEGGRHATALGHSDV